MRLIRAPDIFRLSVDDFRFPVDDFRFPVDDFRFSVDDFRFEEDDIFSLLKLLEDVLSFSLDVVIRFCLPPLSLKESTTRQPS